MCVCVCLCTWLSSPKNTIMMKKSAAHRVEKGIMLTARGYAMKARPGPRKDQNGKDHKYFDTLRIQSVLIVKRPPVSRCRSVSRSPDSATSEMGTFCS